MNYAFHPQAEVELNQAVDYYDARQLHLGRDFAREVHSAIQKHPCVSKRMDSPVKAHPALSRKSISLWCDLSSDG